MLTHDHFFPPSSFVTTCYVYSLTAIILHSQRSVNFKSFRWVHPHPPCITKNNVALYQEPHPKQPVSWLHHHQKKTISALTYLHSIPSFVVVMSITTMSLLFHLCFVMFSINNFLCTYKHFLYEFVQNMADIYICMCVIYIGRDWVVVCFNRTMKRWDEGIYIHSTTRMVGVARQK